MIMKKLSGSKLQLKRVAVGALTSVTGGIEGDTETGVVSKDSEAAPTRQAGANQCAGLSCDGTCVASKACDQEAVALVKPDALG